VKPAVRIALGVVGAGLAGAVVFAAWSRILERQSTLDEINRLRDELYRSRVASDRCRSSLQTSEAALRDLGLSIDSLRARVDSFEALDRRGVPGTEYEDYMVAFDEYNDSVAVWDGRERRLRAADEACRQTITDHNARTDSLQKVLEAAGISGG
jgi:hypothetical protein